MSAKANSLAKPAILPADLEIHPDDIPTDAEDFESGKNNPTENDTAGTPRRAISRLPAGGTRDEPDVRRLLNSYSPISR
jgi:hypothetical protein